MDTFDELLAWLHPAWQRDALCREHGEMSWFPAAGEKPNRQIAICQRCTVRAECVEAAMTNVERFGVWGGSSAAARVRAFVAAA